MVIIAPKSEAEKIVETLKKCPYSADAAIIGEVVETPEERDPRVSIRTGFGALRIMDMLVGEQLPRIC